MGLCRTSGLCCLRLPGAAGGTLRDTGLPQVLERPSCGAAPLGAAAAPARGQERSGATAAELGLPGSACREQMSRSLFPTVPTALAPQEELPCKEQVVPFTVSPRLLHSTALSCILLGNAAVDVGTSWRCGAGERSRRKCARAVPRGRGVHCAPHLPLWPRWRRCCCLLTPSPGVPGAGRGSRHSLGCQEPAWRQPAGAEGLRVGRCPRATAAAPAGAPGCCPRSGGWGRLLIPVWGCGAW